MYQCRGCRFAAFSENVSQRFACCATFLPHAPMKVDEGESQHFLRRPRLSRPCLEARSLSPATTRDKSLSRR